MPGVSAPFFLLVVAKVHRYNHVLLSRTWVYLHKVTSYIDDLFLLFIFDNKPVTSWNRFLTNVLKCLAIIFCCCCDIVISCSTIVGCFAFFQHLC